MHEKANERVFLPPSLPTTTSPPRSVFVLQSLQPSPPPSPSPPLNPFMPHSPTHLEPQQQLNQPTSNAPFSTPTHHDHASDEPEDLLPGADLRNSKARRTPKSGKGRGQLLRLDWGTAGEGAAGRTRGGGGWKGDEQNQQDDSETEEDEEEGKSSSVEQIS